MAIGSILATIVTMKKPSKSTNTSREICTYTSTAWQKKESFLSKALLGYHDLHLLRLCYLKSGGPCDAWTQAPCRAALGGGAPSAPHADPCPQDAPTPQLPSPGDSPAGRGPHG